MKLFGIFTVAVSVLGHKTTIDYTSKFPIQPIPAGETLFIGVEVKLPLENSLRKLKMKLNLCQPTVCNKCGKIVYENFPRNQVKRCRRVLELEDCCDQVKGYDMSWFG